MVQPHIHRPSVQSGIVCKVVSIDEMEVLSYERSMTLVERAEDQFSIHHILKFNPMICPTTALGTS